MPQATRNTIGFSEEDLVRLREITEITGASQRVVISALINQPKDHIVSLVAAAKERAKSEKKKRVVISSRKMGKLTPEQVALIEGIVNDD